MKHFKFIRVLFSLIILISLLSGCSDNRIMKNDYTEENSHYIDGKDYQYMYFTQGAAPQMAESKDGYYFLSGHYLYYADKKSMKPAILCSKPNCLHDRETDSGKVINCDAYLGSSNKFLAYYDGSIYATSENYDNEFPEDELIKISPDGTKRKSILKFDIPPNSLAIHRGKIYYTQTAFDKNQNAIYQIRELELGNILAKPKDIYVGNLEGGSIQDLICYDNSMYFTEFAHNPKAFATRVMRYDILSGKTNRMFTNDDTVNVGVPDIYDNMLYYSINKINVDGTIKERKSFICDLDGRNAKESFYFDYISNILADKQYLYVCDVSWSPYARPKDKQGLAIVDKNGKVMDNIKTGSLESNQTVICGGEDHLFIRTYTDDKLKIFYVDKKQFGSGRIELKLFFEIEKSRMTPGVVIKH